MVCRNLQYHHVFAATVPGGEVVGCLTDEGFQRNLVLLRPAVSKVGMSACGGQSEHSKERQTTESDFPCSFDTRLQLTQTAVIAH